MLASVRPYRIWPNTDILSLIEYLSPTKLERFDTLAALMPPSNASLLSIASVPPEVDCVLPGPEVNEMDPSSNGTISEPSAVNRIRSSSLPVMRISPNAEPTVEATHRSVRRCGIPGGAPGYQSGFVTHPQRCILGTSLAVRVNPSISWASNEATT